MVRGAREERARLGLREHVPVCAKIRILAPLDTGESGSGSDRNGNGNGNGIVGAGVQSPTAAAGLRLVEAGAALVTVHARRRPKHTSWRGAAAERRRETRKVMRRERRREKEKRRECSKGAEEKDEDEAQEKEEEEEEKEKETPPPPLLREKHLREARPTREDFAEVAKLSSALKPCEFLIIRTHT